MNNDLMKIVSDYENEDNKQYVTFKISGQLFGIYVLSVNEILSPHKISDIPLSSKEILGSLNLRGRILTTIDIREVLNIPIPEGDDLTKKMSLVIEASKESYNMVVDEIGDVVSINNSDISPLPENLNPKWLKVSNGVRMLEDSLLVILDVGKIIALLSNESKSQELEI